MNAVILTSEQFESLGEKISELRDLLINSKQNQSCLFVDNLEFVKLMSISKRTAQNWRDSGLIGFSQIGSKIYYRMQDVEAFLDSNHQSSF